MLDQWKALKTWQQGAFIGVLLFLWLIGTITQRIEQRQAVEQAQIEQAQRAERATIVPGILDQITASTGYRPEIIQWGQSRALTIPKRAYVSLTLHQQEQIAAWMEDQYGGDFFVFVGQIQGDTMTLDEQIYP